MAEKSYVSESPLTPQGRSGVAFTLYHNYIGWPACRRPKSLIRIQKIRGGPR
jgi:hypothetical protein